MTPLVSAIMPTRGRTQWAKQALECFLFQNYPNKELVIVDDMDDRSFPEGVMIGGVKYHLLETKLSIPEKRNKACEYSSGDVIWHLDSDDWSDYRRMGQQIGLLMETGKSVTGYHSILFFEEPDKVAKYMGRSNYACGTSLCYQRAFWKKYRWNESKLKASDNAFVREAVQANQLHSVDGGQMVVARAHSGNTCDKKMYNYKTMSLSDLPAEFPK